ncbi:uncharacterized protein EI97DRAFT_400707 [Westerdykella ornata]|uniref:Uncharacterized protein n=1 Tax=Westerdykella ornata TaxID=318751 RepID=A0A6A6JGH0_WESOR|nr:uncharacterized protein EI97DRAFT_400707 [Westerdykella ornata]KAF2275213.1 hypothetical protein EI97DRAFT_400707 [Westerdykella ornata]
MRANFTQCRLEFSANTTEGEELRAKWGWHGPIVGIERNNFTQISKAGCLHLCGPGRDYYPWEDVSSTITTWILPVIGTLLQAPFESNAARRTLQAITRWVGSPIASLSYVLWSIKVSAKAALMVDMSVKYDETPDWESDFGNMRDSMYLLLVMNQYTLKPTAASAAKEAEGLLRIVLFSKDLVLRNTNLTLRQRRQELARELREMRRRGTVPAFVSIMWFLFAFALSIQDAFGALGSNSTAHDLALGCLLAWFPILIMGSIIDRNPIAAEAIREKLNALVDDVRDALCDERNLTDFIDTFPQDSESEELGIRVREIARRGQHMNRFFSDFAGQGRIRWHYGAAHPILSDIENCYIAHKGRNWLANDEEARARLVLGPVNDEGLVWFDIREFWQVASATVIVLGSCGGAFILSYFTPTVGLGCRSGGYTIFFSVALGLMIVEMIVWLVLSPYEVDPLWLCRNSSISQLEGAAHERWRRLRRRASRLLVATEALFIRCAVGLVLLFPWREHHAVKEHVEAALENILQTVREMSPQRRWELFFFRPVETFNTIWLVYIVAAQTTGWYKTCDCVTSSWAGGGGYLDFSVQDSANSKWVFAYWCAGTILTSVVMGFSLFYITVEWCQQSFLSTENYSDAMRGLRRTRKYRHWTFVFRRISRKVSKYTLDPLESLAIMVGLTKQPQKTLLWTKEHAYNWHPAHPPPATPSRRHRPSPSIELSDFSTPAHHAGSQIQWHDPVYPPSTIPTRRPRNESGASLSPPGPLTPTRPSHDSSMPLLQGTSETYRRGSNSEGRSSGEGRAGSEDAPSHWANQEQRGDLLDPSTMLHSRRGHRRADSDAGSPSEGIVGAERRGMHGPGDVDLERGTT